MKVLPALFVSICILALTAPASAQLSATMGGGYAHISGDGEVQSDWNSNGAVALAVPRTLLNFQGDFGYARPSTGQGSDSDMNGGISAFLANRMYRTGAVISYTDIGFTGGSNHLVNYGGFGEVFVGPLTFGAKGGGFNGNNAIGGLYGGAEATTYFLKDLALTGTVDYARFSSTHVMNAFNETDFSAQGEWLVSSLMPISLYGGYTFSSLSRAPNGQASTIFAGVRIYLNGIHAFSLEERQRTDTVSWANHFGPIGANL